MNTRKYTEQSDWENYWRNRVITPFDKLFVDDYLHDFPSKGKLIEIGGFPGNYAGYFKKKFNYDVAILDYIMMPEIIRLVEDSYDLPEGSIRAIEADFFESSIEERFDVVTSLGFIEHFEDTGLVLKKHIDLLNENGKLLVTLPNFRGLNGMVQKYLDPKNYAIHNIESMKISKLRNIMEGMGLKQYRVEYHGKPTIWLEADAHVKTLTSKLLIFTARIIKRIPFRNNRFLAPYIVIYGVK